MDRLRPLLTWASGSHLRRRTARFRLTALYCCLFLPSAVVLCVITYVVILVVERPTDTGHLARTLTRHSPLGGSVPRGAGSGGTVVTVTLPGHVILDTRELLVGLCILAGVLIGASVLLGWIVAGRVLRPLRVMTAATLRISERNLHERLALPGPADELKALGDTIDGLLARLEAAFDSQRRFVANASHELRTPLMLNQAILQVALADPDLTLDSLRTACAEAIDAGKHQAQLIEALLALARSQGGLDRREPIELATVVADTVDAYRTSSLARGLHLDFEVEPGVVVGGDRRLLATLVSNLVDNAVRYNVTGGRVHVTLSAGPSEVVLVVSNSGPSVAPDDVGRLLEPFQRAARDRIGAPTGYGLGLSLVADIARAHGATLVICPRSGGGLTVTVRFAAADGCGSASELERRGRASGDDGRG